MGQEVEALLRWLNAFFEGSKADLWRDVEAYELDDIKAEPQPEGQGPSADREEGDQPVEEEDPIDEEEDGIGLVHVTKRTQDVAYGVGRQMGPVSSKDNRV